MKNRYIVRRKNCDPGQDQIVSISLLCHPDTGLLLDAPLVFTPDSTDYSAFPTDLNVTDWASLKGYIKSECEDQCDEQFMTCKKFRGCHFAYNNDNRGCGVFTGFPIAYFGDYTYTKFEVNGVNMLPAAGVTSTYASWNDNFDVAWVPTVEAVSPDPFDWQNIGKPCYRVMSTINCGETVYGSFCGKYDAASIPRYERHVGKTFEVIPQVRCGQELEFDVCITKSPDGKVTQQLLVGGEEVTSLVDYIADQYSHITDPVTGAPLFSSAALLKLRTEEEWRKCLKSCDYVYPEVDQTDACVVEISDGCIASGTDIVVSGVTRILIVCEGDVRDVQYLLPPGIQEDPSLEVEVDTEQLDLDNPGWYFTQECDSPTPPEKADSYFRCDASTCERVEFCVLDNGDVLGPYLPGSDIPSTAKGPFVECSPKVCFKTEEYKIEEYNYEWDNGYFSYGRDLTVTPHVYNTPHGSVLLIDGSAPTSYQGFIDRQLTCGTATIDQIVIDGQVVASGIVMPAQTGTWIQLNNMMWDAATAGSPYNLPAGRGCDVAPAIPGRVNCYGQAKTCDNIPADANGDIGFFDVTDCRGRQWRFSIRKTFVGSKRYIKSYYKDCNGKVQCEWIDTDTKAVVVGLDENCMTRCDIPAEVDGLPMVACEAKSSGGTSIECNDAEQTIAPSRIRVSPYVSGELMPAQIEQGWLDFPAAEDTSALTDSDSSTGFSPTVNAFSNILLDYDLSSAPDCASVSTLKVCSDGEPMALGWIVVAYDGATNTVIKTASGNDGGIHNYNQSSGLTFGGMVLESMQPSPQPASGRYEVCLDLDPAQLASVSDLRVALLGFNRGVDVLYDPSLKIVLDCSACDASQMDDSGSNEAGDEAVSVKDCNSDAQLACLEDIKELLPGTPAPVSSFELIDDTCYTWDDNGDTVEAIQVFVFDLSLSPPAVVNTYYIATNTTTNYNPGDIATPPVNPDDISVCAEQPVIDSLDVKYCATVDEKDFSTGDEIICHEVYNVALGEIGSGDEVLLYTTYINEDGQAVEFDPVAQGLPCPDTLDPSVKICKRCSSSIVSTGRAGIQRGSNYSAGGITGATLDEFFANLEAAGYEVDLSLVYNDSGNQAADIRLLSICGGPSPLTSFSYTNDVFGDQTIGLQYSAVNALCVELCNMSELLEALNKKPCCEPRIVTDAVCYPEDVTLGSVNVLAGFPVIRQTTYERYYDEATCTCRDVVDGGSVAFYDFDNPLTDVTAEVNALELEFQPCDPQLSRDRKQCTPDGTVYYIVDVTVGTSSGVNVSTTVYNQDGVPVEAPEKLGTCPGELYPTCGCIRNADGVIVVRGVSQWQGTDENGQIIYGDIRTNDFSQAIVTLKSGESFDCDCSDKKKSKVELTEYSYDTSNMAFPCDSPSILIDGKETELCDNDDPSNGSVPTVGDICTLGGVRSNTGTQTPARCGRPFSTTDLLGAASMLLNGGMVVPGGSNAYNDVDIAVRGSFNLSGPQASLTLGMDYVTNSAGISFFAYDCATDTYLQPTAASAGNLQSYVPDQACFAQTPGGGAFGNVTLMGTSIEFDSSAVADVQTVVFGTIVQGNADTFGNLTLNGVPYGPQSCTATSAQDLAQLLNGTTGDNWTVSGSTLTVKSEKDYGAITCGETSVDPTKQDCSRDILASYVALCPEQIEQLKTKQCLMKDVVVKYPDTASGCLKACQFIDPETFEMKALRLVDGTDVIALLEDCGIELEYVDKCCECDADSVVKDPGCPELNFQDPVFINDVTVVHTGQKLHDAGDEVVFPFVGGPNFIADFMSCVSLDQSCCLLRQDMETVLTVRVTYEGHTVNPTDNNHSGFNVNPGPGTIINNYVGSNAGAVAVPAGDPPIDRWFDIEYTLGSLLGAPGYDQACVSTSAYGTSNTSNPSVPFSDTAFETVQGVSFAVSPDFFQQLIDLLALCPCPENERRIVGLNAAREGVPAGTPTQPVVDEFIMKSGLTKTVADTINVGGVTGPEINNEFVAQREEAIARNNVRKMDVQVAKFNSKRVIAKAVKKVRVKEEEKKEG